MTDDYTPTKGEFVFVITDGTIDYPGKVVQTNPLTRTALVVPVGEDVDPLPVAFNRIQRHPLSTQRGIPEA